MYFVGLLSDFFSHAREGNRTADAGETEPDRARERRARILRGLMAYFFGLAMVVAGTVLRLGLDPVLGDHHPFTLYFAAVALTAWYGGFGPAFFATMASYFAADWFFITPRFELNLPHTNLDEFIALVAFLFSCLAIAFTSQRMRTALVRARAKQAELEREVGQREKAEQALRQAQKRLRRHADELEEKVQERTEHLQETVRSLEGVCYHIAHDLRAPLRAMHGFTDILERDYGQALDAKAKHYLENIGSASTRMDLLIHGLLEYGRLGHEEYRMADVEAGRILERVIEQLEGEIKRTKAVVECEGPFPTVEANAGLLEKVLWNLLDNAVKFVGPGVAPRVRISCEESADGQTCRIVVQDNGIGIPQEQLSRTFWIFERIHPRENFPGIGIGLAIALKAVERMQGRMGVESEVGRGSRFWFELRRESEFVEGGEEEGGRVGAGEATAEGQAQPRWG